MHRLLKSRRAVIGNEIKPAAILIDGEVIKEILPYPSTGSGQAHDGTSISADIPVNDYGDLALMPGVVDTHVHINQPGRTEWEGFQTATAAAAKGGITTLVDMPLNCDPVTTTRAALEAKIKSCAGLLHVDCGFYGGVIPGNLGDLEPMIDAGVLGFKSFLIHSGIHEFPHCGEAELRAAIPILKKAGVPYLMHAELDDDALRQAQGDVTLSSSKGDHRLYSTYLASRPRRWENNAIELMARLAGETNAHLHIVHLSSTDRLDLLSETRRRGINLSVETCHHYLTYCAEEIPDGATEFKCAPPIRERENREKLWAGLKDGTIDFAVSDHSPCTPELKAAESGDFMKAWGGIAGLQFSLSVFHTGARARGLSLSQISHYLSTAPAKFVGLKNKGSIAVGKDADFVVFDADKKFHVERNQIAHRHDVSPYIGMELTGFVKETWLRGVCVHREGKSTGPAGRPILR
ncbi:MAG: allantoinase AllB [Spirochaetes bacterium]|nr:allantoinase AllB [Spirochaetota bacterium]